MRCLNYESFLVDFLILKSAGDWLMKVTAKGG